MRQSRNGSVDVEVSYSRTLAGPLSGDAAGHTVDLEGKVVRIRAAHTERIAELELNAGIRGIRFELEDVIPRDLLIVE